MFYSPSFAPGSVYSGYSASPYLGATYTSPFSHGLLGTSPFSYAPTYSFAPQEARYAAFPPPPAELRPPAPSHNALQTYTGPHSALAAVFSASPLSATVVNPPFSAASTLTTATLFRGGSASLWAASAVAPSSYGGLAGVITEPIVLTPQGSAVQLPQASSVVPSAFAPGTPVRALPSTQQPSVMPSALPASAVPSALPTSAVPTSHQFAAEAIAASNALASQVSLPSTGHFSTAIPSHVASHIPTAQPSAVPSVHQTAPAPAPTQHTSVVIVATALGPQAVVVTHPAPASATPSPPQPEQVTKRSYDFASQTWTESRITVTLDTTAPISSGTFRTAYHMRDHSRALNDQHMVAKVMHAKLFSADKVEGEVRTLAFCEYLARNFNLRAPLKPVHFVEAYVIYRDRPGLQPHERVVAVEQFLDGRFEKFNDNFGWYGDRKTPQAFTHFTYQATNGRLMVVDMQGVGNTYTDPQIHSTDRIGFGAGNCGLAGMRKFFDSHRCNDICRYLLLPHHEGPNAPPATVVGPNTFFPTRPPPSSAYPLSSHVAAIL